MRQNGEAIRVSSSSTRVEEAAGNAQPVFRSSEWVLLAYFSYTALLSFLFPVSVPIRTCAIALPCALSLLAWAHSLSHRRWACHLRDWMPAPLVLAAYWEVDWFQPAARLRDLEQSWLTWDHAVLYGYGFRSAVESLGRLIPSILEISYVLVYAVPPLCIAAFYVWGHRERVDRFLFTFLLGTLLAYALLPHFPSASPRLEFPGQDLPTILTVWRKFNIWILNFGDIHTSVFPSGHVTAGFSAAFAMMRTLPEKKWLGRGLLIHAALVTLATIYGRYHYVADCLAGITLSLVACAGSIALTRVPAARMARSWRAAAAALLVGIFCALTARAGSIPLQRSTVAAQVRLQTHVSSYASKPGDVIRAVVLAPVKERDDVILPRGSVLLGRILKVVSVGRGLIHERASIDLEFNQWLQPDGSAKAIKTQLMSIDNAREQVSPTGRVKGILAAGGAPGFLLGMWSRPDSALFMRTAGGFAGVSHFLCERTTFAPVAVAGIIAARFYAVPLPEPEIHLPPGTELFLSISRLPVAGPFEKEPEAEAPPEALLQLAANVPIRTTRGSSQRLGDITNVMFVGSEDQLNAAFSAAGWSPSELLTPRSAVRVYKAMSAQHGYPTAPMSTMLLEGLTPDHMFQKSFNTMSKRHHLRIWERPESLGGNKVWLGAATHDTGIRFRDGGKTFTHGIDPQIDRERLKVIDDLTFAGCMEKVQLVERPHVSTAGGPAISTDGRLAVITLRDCNANSFEPLGDAPARERNATGRFMRRLVLEGRYAILRGNIYYWGYRFARRTLNRTPAISAPEPVVFDEAALTTTTGLAAASTLQ